MKTRKLFAAAAVCGLLFCSPASAASQTPPGTFNQSGNVLIADQFNNRVIEVDKKGTIVWSWGLGPHDFTKKSPLGVNDAERVGRNTLMAATGIPPKVDKYCEQGCPDNRVLLVDPDGNIVWQYGKFGVTGSGHNELNAPVQSTWAPDKTVYITDQGNQRVIQVDMNKHIVWQYGTTGVAGDGYDELNSPNSAELLNNGNVLIADEGNNRVIEVDKTSKNIVQTWTAQGAMSEPAFASLLPNGKLLVADGGNNRAIVLNTRDVVKFQYVTNTQTGSSANPAPSRAIQTMHGKIVISDQFNDRVIVVDYKGNLLMQYGNLNKRGYGTTSTQQGLFAPYDAKIIGDYTGLTPPY